MYSFDQNEQSLNKFFLVSLILHAILFITYPKWSSILISDLPGVERGGVVQVFSVETSPNRQLSPVTNPNSRSEIPRVSEPRPTQEAPEAEPVAQVAAPTEEPALPTPKPRPEPEPQPVVEQTPAEPVEEVKPEPVDKPDIQPQPPVIEESEPQQAAEVLTSESGTEVVVEREEVPEPEESVPEEESTEVTETESTPPERDPTSEGDSIAETETEEAGPTGSGQSDTGASAEDQGMQESGEGSEESAPPPPPPPPKGSEVLRGDGHVSFPKEAEHDQATGSVRLEVIVSAEGNTMATRVLGSSGDQRLDVHARRTINRYWSFTSAEQDYVVVVDVDFVWEGEVPGFAKATANVHIIEVQWLEEE